MTLEIKDIKNAFLGGGCAFLFMLFWNIYIYKIENSFLLVEMIGCFICVILFSVLNVLKNIRRLK